MSREKKITGHITGDFFNDSKKIASQYFKEIKTGKKSITKNGSGIHSQQLCRSK